MFQHLDDPSAFDASDDLRGRVRRRTVQLHRRRRARRVAALTAIPTAAVIGGALWVTGRLGDVQRLEMATPGTTDPLTTGAPVTLLVLGRDTAGSGAERAAARSDSIAVVRIAGPRITVLSIPRDLWTGSAKVNSLTAEQTSRWLADQLGIHVDHLVAMDMNGFARLADRVRPQVRLEMALRDRDSGLRLSDGCQTLDGSATLSYVRARHLEAHVGAGIWEADPTGDLGRVSRLQSLVASIWGQLDHLGAADLPALVSLFADHATVDSGLDNAKLLTLARRILAVDEPPSFATVPVTPGTTAEGEPVSVLMLRTNDPATDAAVESVGGRVSAAAATAPTILEPGRADTPTLGLVSAC